MIAASALGGVGWNASAQEQPPRETGAVIWRQACAGCHGENSFNGQTLKTIRTLGEPRIRHALVDNDEAAHPMLQTFSETQLRMLIDYLKPGGEHAADCEGAQDCPAGGGAP